MGWKKTFKNSDGSYDTFDWSLATEIKVEAASVIAIMLCVSIFCAAAPLLILFIYPWPGSRKGDLKSFMVAPVFTLIWILDLQFGVFNWFFWRGFPEVYMAITAVNLSISLMCVFFYYYEEDLHNAFRTGFMPLYGFYLFCGVLLYISHSMMFGISDALFTIADTPIWR